MRRQRRRDRLRRFGLLRHTRLLAALRDWRFGKDVAGRQGDIALPGEAVDELSCDDLLDGARGALDFDAVIAFQQRRHLLAGGAEQLRNLVNPNSCQL